MTPPTSPPVDSQLVRTLLAGRFALTAEVTPPAAANPASLLAKAEPLRGLVDAINVTDGASARVHMSSMAAAAALASSGIEPVMQVTCRDRNRIALQSDLLGAAALGVRNVLILRGDDPGAGDQPDAKPVFDFESRDLIQVAAAMRDKAVLPSGRPIEDALPIFIGAADTPFDPPDDWRPDGLEAKAAAGAQFVQTQFCFDAGVLGRYMAVLHESGVTDRLFFLIGVGPLASAKSARWMRENLWGVSIPDPIIDRLERAPDEKEEGIRICAELLQQFTEIPGVSGAHLMAPVNVSSVPAAIERADLARARTISA